MTNRTIKQIFPAVAVPEGRGVTVHRSIGRQGLMQLDPFLLLDEMDITPDNNAVGFPDHPHRGFETVTYMLSGRMQHTDKEGNAGEIGPGEAQWMTAGRGIIHSEMPVTEGEHLHGFQLWVNLPAAKKMMSPRYQDILKDEIPTVEGQSYSARLIAGTLEGQSGPIVEVEAKPFFADITLTEDREITVPVPAGHTAFLYGIAGDMTLADTTTGPRTLIILSDGEYVSLSGKAGTRFILVAGTPFNEPIARQGPFVMNTREEIQTAFDDWNSGRFLTNQ